MTITTQPARNEYTANAGQTVFNYTFKIFSDTDLNVYVTPAGVDYDDSLHLTTDYVVDPSGIGDEDGGFITLNTPTNQDDRVTIVLNVPSSRTIDYQNNGDFRPDTVNSDFDRVVSIAKKVEDLTNRAVLLEQSAQGPKPLSLPPVSPGESIKWKLDGSGFENYKIPNESGTPGEQFGDVTNLVFSDVDSMVNGTLIGGGNHSFSVGEQCSTGGTTWRVNSLPVLSISNFTAINDVNVLDFGATRDGVTDDSASIQAALDYGVDVFIPNGSYLLGSKLTVPSGVSVYGENGTSGTLLDNDGSLIFNGGTRLLVDHGSGIEDSTRADYYANAAVTIGDGCVISGLSFWYPSQNLGSAGPATPFPPAIASESGVKTINIHDIHLGNAYIGIDCRRDQVTTNIDNVKGYPLSVGIRIGSNTDTSNITRINFSPVLALTGVPWISPNISSWVGQNGVMVEVGRQTWATFSKVWGIGYSKGFDLINQSADPGNGINTGGSAQNCNIVESGFDSVEVGIFGLGFQGRLNIDNVNFAPKNFNNTPSQDTWAISLDNPSGSVNNVNISNCNIWAAAEGGVRLKDCDNSSIRGLNVYNMGGLSDGDGVLLDSCFSATLTDIKIDGTSANQTNGVRMINNCERSKLTESVINNCTSAPVSLDATDFANIKNVSGLGNAEPLIQDIAATKKYNNIIKDCNDGTDANYDNSDVDGSFLLTVNRGIGGISYSGTTQISGITHGYRGQRITIRFSANCNVIDQEGAQPQENRLYLSGNFATSFGDTLTLESYGSLGWYEVSRSTN